MLRNQLPVSRVRNNEAAGTVGALGHPGAQTTLPDQCRLLIASNAEYWYGRAEPLCIGYPEVSSAIEHLRQQRCRYIEIGQ